jgi:putative ABC transport system substrate-binding protein
MKSLGHVEGQNFIIDFRYESADLSRLAKLATELVGLNPDVILTITTPATAAAMRATRSIPIVFSGVGDPVAFGLVDSLSRPGGNVTGIANIVADLAGKRLELLKSLIPSLDMVGVPLESHTSVSVLQWEASQRPARELGLRLHSMQITDADSYDAAFARAAQVGVKAVAVSLSPMASSNAAQIVGLAARYRLPAIYARSIFVDAGGLMSYGSSLAADGRAMARLAERILTGAKPADLPVEQPTEFELIFNLKTVRQLGLTIPRPLLLRADRVVE